MSNGKVKSPPAPARPSPPASPRSPTLTAQFILDESSVELLAREANQKPGGTPAPWAGNQADYEVGAGGGSLPVPHDGIVRIGVQVPLPRKPSLPPAGSLPDVTATLKRVQRLGSYSVPIDWRLDGIPLVNLGPANPSQKVEITGRVRISAWAAPNDNWWDGKGDILKFRRDRWTALDDGWGFDDITFTQTVRLMDPAAAPPEGAPSINGKPDPDAVWWANNFLPTLKRSDKKLTDWMRDAIQFFHAHKIQVFAGYEIVTQDWNALPPPDLKNAKTQAEIKKILDDREGKVKDMKVNRRYGDAFVQWLSAKGTTMSDFEAHAKKLVGFFDDRGLDIDGISYDLEIDAKNNGKGLGPRHAPAIEALYLAVVRQLSLKERYLAFAAAPIPNATYMHEQPYTLGNIINIIVRTMSYRVPSDKGQGSYGGSKGKTGEGRKRVVIDSLQKLNLHPSHLQIGLTTREGQPGKISVEEAKQECETYRSHRVGLAHWYLEVNKEGPSKDYDLGQYREYDRALNTGPPPRGTRGQPLQGPLGPQRLKAFADARAAEDRGKGAPTAK